MMGLSSTSSIPLEKANTTVASSSPTKMWPGNSSGAAAKNTSPKNASRQAGSTKKRNPFLSMVPLKRMSAVTWAPKFTPTRMPRWMKLKPYSPIMGTNRMAVRLAMIACTKVPTMQHSVVKRYDGFITASRKNRSSGPSYNTRPGLARGLHQKSMNGLSAAYAVIRNQRRNVYALQDYGHA